MSAHVLFNRPAEFVAELEADAGAVHRHLVRATERAEASGPGGMLRRLYVEAAYQVTVGIGPEPDLQLVRLDYLAGEWMPGGPELEQAKVADRARTTRELIARVAEGHLLAVRAGVLRDHGVPA